MILDITNKKNTNYKEWLEVYEPTHKAACLKDPSFKPTNFKEKIKNILLQNTKIYPSLDIDTKNKLYDLSNCIRKELLTLKLRSLTKEACEENKSSVNNDFNQGISRNRSVFFNISI
jgi:hypothetical protein